ncbi:hypothetical protein [Paraburkholderia sp. SIMBA_054]|uniref:hypothetical protein n=1 Tax=Paraburkholderia sp. SIMBA_054 TaxID=3085795 RepID=UPI0039795C2D
MDTLTIATNHLGWNVETLTRQGWKPIHDTPYAQLEDARELLALTQRLNQEAEYRVYEALEFPVKEKA